MLGVAPAHWPLELRGDVMWALWPSYAGPVSATAIALVPLGTLTLGAGPRIQPYAIAGVGSYGIGGGRARFGANVGGGARFDFARTTPFVEVRRHSAYARTFATFGVALQR